MTSAIPAGLISAVVFSPGPISAGLVSLGPIRTAVRNELAVLPARAAAAVPPTTGSTSS